jgi:muconolactone delta-isomerase
MEYLVTMTTSVPEGTTEAAVDAIRGREAERSRELSREGHLLRLWRPPLAPGEWRSIGLFAASDEIELEVLLASMPLRVWRSDQVVALASHPNDPRKSRAGSAREFFTTFTVTIPGDADPAEVNEIEAREAGRTRELAEQGHLLRLWKLPSVPGSWRALGLWQGDDAAELQTLLDSLPMNRWMTTELTALTQHPSDPGTTRD